MQLKKALIVSAAIAALGVAAPSFADSYDDAVKDAKAEIGKAKKMSYTWRDTEKHLKKADKAKKEGDMKKAMKLVKKAKTEAMLAQKQAMAESNPKVSYKW